MHNLDIKRRDRARDQPPIPVPRNQRLRPQPRNGRDMPAHQPPALRGERQAFMPKGEDQRFPRLQLGVFGAFKLPACGGPDQPQIKPDQPRQQRLGGRMADQPLEHRGWAFGVIKAAVARIAMPGNGAGTWRYPGPRKPVSVLARFIERPFAAAWLRENDHHGFA